MAPVIGPKFLTIPCELRNAIYHHVFAPDPAVQSHTSQHRLDSLALQLQVVKPIEDRRKQALSDLRVLQTSRQIHDEAHQLALSMTSFDVTGECAKPECFASQCSMLRASKISALRDITVTSRISYLRSMNEDWNGYPFGHRELVLDTLKIVPTKANSTHTSYAEVADLSQVHTLAYILAETVKGLRNVRVLQVENRGCFKEVVFRLVYRSLVYRLFRWAGRHPGVRVRCSNEENDSTPGWLQVLMKEDPSCESEDWRDVGDEVDRFLGRDGEMPNPALVGF